MKKKDHRRVRATVVLDIVFYIDKDTQPEDVLSNSNLCIDSDMGRVTEKNLIHSAITKIEKVN